jgi:serine/threonine protein kinase
MPNPTDRSQFEPAGSVPQTTQSTPTSSPAASGDSEPPFRPATHPDDLGRLKKYRVLKELGRGGMGAVYLGYDEALRRRVALKVMLPRFAAAPSAKERFLREARAAAAIKSDHVVTIFDVDEDNGIPFIAMEYLQGMSLDQHLRQVGVITIEQAMRIGREVAIGLAAAHQRGLIHRDIKPANLWLEAPNGRVKILDFGLARHEEEVASLTEGSSSIAAAESDSGTDQLTSTGALVGTPAYMSPEQARGRKLDQRSDLFSLGAVLYRLVIGRLPFTGATRTAVLLSLAMDEPPPVRELNPDVPESLAKLIGRLLAKEPAARPESAKAVVAAFEQMSAPSVSGSGQHVVFVPIAVEAQEESVWEQIDEPPSTIQDMPSGSREKRRSRASVWPIVASVVGLLLVVALAIGIGMKVFRKPSEPEQVQKEDPKVEPNQTPEEKPAPLPAGWQSLFDGKDASAWRSDDGPVRWHVRNGYIESAPGAGDIITKQSFGDYQLYLEYWLAPLTVADVNFRSVSHVFLQALYGVRLCDDYGLPAVINSTGGIVHRVPPTRNASKPSGQWQTLEIEYVATRRDPAGAVKTPGRVSVLLNGVRVLDKAELTLTSDLSRVNLTDEVSGPIVLGRTEHGSVRFRNIRIRPLEDPTFFNGKDLTDWESYPENTDAWRVEKGAIVGRNKSKDSAYARLMTQRSYSDFELSFEIRGLGVGENYPNIRFRFQDENRLGTGGPTLAFAAIGGIRLLRTFVSGAISVPFKPADFNAITIRAVGKRLTIQANGVVLADGESDLPSDGVIGFGLPSGIAEANIRNIRFIDLSKRFVDAERNAAEELRRTGAELTLRIANGAIRKYLVGDPLPIGPFTITEIHWMDPTPASFTGNFTGKDLAKIVADLRELRVMYDRHKQIRVSAADVARLADGRCGGSLNQIGLRIPLDSLALDHLKRFTGLTSLSLHADAADDALLVRLAGLKNLTELGLTQLGKSGKVGPYGMAAIAKLPLQRVSFSELMIKAETMTGVAELSNLQSLSLRRTTNVDDYLPGFVRKCPNVMFLDLGESDLTDAGLKLVQGMRALKKIVLTKTKVTAAAVAAFKMAVPGCTVEMLEGPEGK